VGQARSGPHAALARPRLTDERSPRAYSERVGSADRLKNDVPHAACVGQRFLYMGATADRRGVCPTTW